MLGKITVATIVISILVYLHGARKDKHQIDIALLDELRKEKPNRYLVERLFFYLYRCTNIRFEEIIILVNHRSPRVAIQKFTASCRWSHVFRLKFENGSIGYELQPGFETRSKRVRKCLTALVVFLFMYLITIYFGNKFFSLLTQVISDFISGGINVSDGFERLFTVVISFFVTAMVGVSSVLSVMVFMSIAFSVHHAKEIVRLHNEYPCLDCESINKSVEEVS